MNQSSRFIHIKGMLACMHIDKVHYDNGQCVSDWLFPAPDSRTHRVSYDVKNITTLYKDDGQSADLDSQIREIIQNNLNIMGHTLLEINADIRYTGPGIFEAKNICIIKIQDMTL